MNEAINAITEVDDLILGYEYVNGGIWCIREYSIVEPNGDCYSEEWRELICELPLFNPNSDTAESEEKHINDNGEMIATALNLLNATKGEEDE